MAIVINFLKNKNMEKYINDLSQKYAALDKEVEGKIKEFLVNAVNNKWNVCVDVNLHNGEVARLNEIRLSEGKVRYVQSEFDYELNCGDMDFGEVLKVLSCLPDSETFLRLNSILKKDSLYEINELLESYPYHQKDLGKISKFEIVNSHMLLTSERGFINSYSKENEIADFIDYLTNTTSSIGIGADFKSILTNIMRPSEASEIWDEYKERIISDMRKSCNLENYNRSDVCIAITNLLREKLLNK